MTQKTTEPRTAATTARRARIGSRIPVDLLRQVDHLAKTRGVSRSELIRQTVEGLLRVSRGECCPVIAGRTLNVKLELVDRQPEPIPPIEMRRFPRRHLRKEGGAE